VTSIQRTHIRRTLHNDTAALEATAALMRAVQEHDFPRLPGFTPRQLQLWHEFPWPGRKSEHYLSYHDGEPAARLEIGYPTLDNLKSAFVTIEVHPAYRRRRLGTELFAFAVERMRDEGRTALLTESAWELPDLPVHDGGSGPAFAQAMGLESANLPAVLRRLDLSTVDEAVLDAMVRNADGYRLVQWFNRAPDEYVDDIAYLDGRLLQDAPTGDLALEAEKVDAARTRAMEEVNAARGRHGYNTGVVHEASDRVVAWTAISHDPEIPWHAWQNITIVDPDHRGHRLGALVKVANLRLLREREPQVTIVDTSNAAVNAYMIAINEQMGFRPLYAWQSWQREF
jgi:GNAT superfamily N-acetyltransferase